MKRIQTLEGIIVSTKMKKTVVVEVSRLKQHPKYKKFIRVSKRYKAHNETEDVHEGDRAKIQLSRPFSKDKRWILVKKNI